jgi:hypothetical protein
MTRGISPLQLAREAQHMAQGADQQTGKVFQHVAMVSMIVTAGAAAIGLFRELTRKETHRGRE